MQPVVRRTSGVLAVTTVALALAAPVAAYASSLVFVRNHDVWLAKPDGTGQARVTSDGTSASPYYSPTQADDGKIVALRGPDGRPDVATYSGGGSRLYRLAQSGRRLSRPRISLFRPLPALVGRAIQAEVSPNGRTVAISQLLYEGSLDPSGRRRLRAVAQNVVYKSPASGRYRGKTEIVLVQLASPSWVDNGRLLVFDQFSQVGAQVLWASIGREPTPLYRDPARSTLVPDWNGAHLGAGEMTRAGDRLALTRSDIGGGNPTIEIYAAGGLTAPPTPACTLAGRDIDSEPSLSWSPDGAGLAWHEGSGIWSSPVDLSAPGCGLAPRLVIRGGIAPDWGRADVRRAG